MTDEELDARFRALGHPEPPEPIVRATLAAVHRDRVRPRLRLVYAGAVAVALAAAAALAVRVEPPHGDPARMVARGGDGAGVRLEATVRCGDRGLNYRAESPVAVGDTLALSVVSDAGRDVVVARDGVEVWRGHVDAGETFVPKGWRFEAGEAPATWTVRSGDASWDLYVRAPDPTVAPCEGAP